MNRTSLTHLHVFNKVCRGARSDNLWVSFLSLSHEPLLLMRVMEHLFKLALALLHAHLYITGTFLRNVINWGMQVFMLITLRFTGATCSFQLLYKCIWRDKKFSGLPLSSLESPIAFAAIYCWSSLHVCILAGPTVCRFWNVALFWPVGGFDHYLQVYINHLGHIEADTFQLHLEEYWIVAKGRMLRKVVT